MLQIVLGSIAGLFCLWAYREAGKLPSCKHRLEDMDLEHPALLDCDVALSAAVFVREAWPTLNRYFPGQRRKRFTFIIYFDKRDCRYGFQWTDEGVAFNLATSKLRKEDILGTIVHEIHHLREEMAGIKPEFRFPQPKGLLTHEDIVKYNALNPHEYRALKARWRLWGPALSYLKRLKSIELSMGSNNGELYTRVYLSVCGKVVCGVGRSNL